MDKLQSTGKYTYGDISTPNGEIQQIVYEWIWARSGWQMHFDPTLFGKVSITELEESAIDKVMRTSYRQWRSRSKRNLVSDELARAVFEPDQSRILFIIQLTSSWHCRSLRFGAVLLLASLGEWLIDEGDTYYDDEGAMAELMKIQAGLISRAVDVDPFIRAFVAEILGSWTLLTESAEVHEVLNMLLCDRHEAVRVAVLNAGANNVDRIKVIASFDYSLSCRVAAFKLLLRLGPAQIGITPVEAAGWLAQCTTLSAATPVARILLRVFHYDTAIEFVRLVAPISETAARALLRVDPEVWDELTAELRICDSSSEEAQIVQILAAMSHSQASSRIMHTLVTVDCTDPDFLGMLAQVNPTVVLNENLERQYDQVFGNLINAVEINQQSALQAVREVIWSWQREPEEWTSRMNSKLQILGRHENPAIQAIVAGVVENLECEVDLGALVAKLNRNLRGRHDALAREIMSRLDECVDVNDLESALSVVGKYHLYNPRSLSRLPVTGIRGALERLYAEKAELTDSLAVKIVFFESFRLFDGSVSDLIEGHMAVHQRFDKITEPESTEALHSEIKSQSENILHIPQISNSKVSDDSLGDLDSVEPKPVEISSSMVSEMSSRRPTSQSSHYSSTDRTSLLYTLSSSPPSFL